MMGFGREKEGKKMQLQRQAKPGDFSDPFLLRRPSTTLKLSCWNSQLVIANGTNICFCTLSLSRNEAQFSLMTSRILLPSPLLRGRTHTVTHTKSIPKAECRMRNPFCPCQSPRHQRLDQTNKPFRPKSSFFSQLLSPYVIDITYLMPYPKAVSGTSLNAKMH